MRKTIFNKRLCAIIVAIAGPAMSLPADGLGDNGDRRAVATESGRKSDLTLTSALERALEHNGALRGAAHRVPEAEAWAQQAGIPPNPSLELEIDEVAGSDPRGGFDAAEVTVAISQSVELGGKRRKRRSVAEFEKTLAELDLQTQRLELTARVKKAFVELLAAQEAAAIAENGAAIARKLHDTVVLRVKAGQDASVERDNAAIVLAKATLGREDALAALDVARGALSATWGNAEPDFARAVGNIGAPSAIPSQQEVLASASECPAFQMWETQVRRIEAEGRLADAAAVPDIELLGGFKQYEEDGGHAFLVGVSIPLPLFDRNQGERSAAKLRLAAARSEQDQAETDLIAELRGVYGRLHTAHRRAVAFDESILPAARTAYQTLSKGYAEGKFGLLRVLDAQRTLLEAHQERLNAGILYHIARAEAERLIGRSLDSISEPTDTERKTQ